MLKCKESGVDSSARQCGTAAARHWENQLRGTKKNHYIKLLYIFIYYNI